jgi:hypothetical protein
MIPIRGLTTGSDLIDHGRQVVPDVLYHIFAVWMIGEHFREKSKRSLRNDIEVFVIGNLSERSDQVGGPG